MNHETAHESFGAAGGRSAGVELMASGVRRRPEGGLLRSVFRALARRVLGVFGPRRRLGRLGPYELVEKIGEGGMGVVYKATRRRGGRPFALKLLLPSRSSTRDIERFEREARVTTMLRHPNTIAVYDSGRTREGAPYYVMEYLEGLDLQSLVALEGPQPPRRVARLLAQLAGALSEVHALGLLHGDVKPANVVLCGRGSDEERAKILDFGLAREVGGDETPSAEPEIAGTPLYLSPEALIAPERVDGRSDLYALGAIGYFLLTGAPPFTGGSVLDVFVKHLHATPETPSRRRRQPVPRELERIVLRCLAKSPAERPKSAAALRDSLLPLAA